MARSRNIKPGFFTNEELGVLSPDTRLLFIGLWTLADREGRLEDRPKRIKVEIFPYDKVEVEPLLGALIEAGFLERYQVGDQKVLLVTNFIRHQKPHHMELPSKLPPPPKGVNKFNHSPINKEQRQRILTRDDYTCVICGSKDSPAIDHIVPVSKGGTSGDNNLRVLCSECNGAKGNRLDGEWQPRQRIEVDPNTNRDQVEVDSTNSGYAPLIPSCLIPSCLIPDSLNEDSLIHNHNSFLPVFSENKNPNQNTTPPSFAGQEQDPIPVPPALSQAPESSNVTQRPDVDVKMDLDLEDKIDKFTENVYSRNGRRSQMPKLHTRDSRALLERLEKAEADYGPEDLRRALTLYVQMQDSWLREAGWPLANFLKYPNKYILTSAEAPASPARRSQPSRATDTPDCATGLETPVVAFPDFVLRWNAAVPTGLQEKYWNGESPKQALRAVESEAEFVDNFDLICQRCTRLYLAGVYKQKPDFSWLFKTKAKEHINWWRVVHEEFVWLENPAADAPKSASKSPGELARERLAKVLEKEKQKNGQNGSQQSTSGSDDRGGLGVPDGRADDAERAEGVGAEPAGNRQ